MEKAIRNYSYRGPAGVASPAGRALSDALDLAMDGRSPYPDRSTFVNAGMSDTDRQIAAAAREGHYAVVVSPNGETRVVSPEQALAKGRDAA